MIVANGIAIDGCVLDGKLGFDIWGCLYCGNKLKIAHAIEIGRIFCFDCNEDAELIEHGYDCCNIGIRLGADNDCG